MSDRPGDEGRRVARREGQRRAVVVAEWFAVDFVGEQSLRVEHAFHVEPHVVALAGRRHADVIRQVFGACLDIQRIPALRCGRVNFQEI